jgi:flagellar biosynthetic protein FliP
VKHRSLYILSLAIFALISFMTPVASAQETDPAEITLTGEQPESSFDVESLTEGFEMGTSMKIVLVLTALAALPSILMTITAFTRIIIVLSFVRKALSIQDMPPNQIVIGMALFLSIAVMQPVFQEIYDGAVSPYMEDEIALGEAADKAHDVMHGFLLRHAQEDEIQLFLDVTSADEPATAADVPITVLIPAFTLSELKVAFKMGFLVYIPFLIVDMVVASLLLAMGMMMLPPVIISTPFKILLFIMVDGWSLVIGSLMESFQIVG